MLAGFPLQHYKSESWTATQVMHSSRSTKLFTNLLPTSQSCPCAHQILEFLAFTGEPWGAAAIYYRILDKEPLCEVEEGYEEQWCLMPWPIPSPLWGPLQTRRREKCAGCWEELGPTNICLLEAAV